MSSPNYSEKSKLPIGIFDSGMGGLTVLHELMKHLPQESFIYLGDTARLPYGTKSVETIRNYSRQMASALLEQNIKLLIIACNTATAAALTYLEELFPQIPIIGVIKPGAVAAINATKSNKIAVLATEATITSGIYEQTLRTLNPDVRIVSQSCGLFVALAEEGCVDDELVEAAAKKYLLPVLNNGIQCDCVLLGCTHFPVLIKPIKRILGSAITVVNSAKTTAVAVAETLEKLNLKNGAEKSTTKFLVTDLPERFIRVGKIFLERAINPDMVFLIDSIKYYYHSSEGTE